jgi:hypothetical protein
VRFRVFFKPDFAFHRQVNLFGRNASLFRQAVGEDGSRFQGAPSFPLSYSHYCERSTMKKKS